MKTDKYNDHNMSPHFIYTILISDNNTHVMVFVYMDITLTFRIPLILSLLVINNYSWWRVGKVFGDYQGKPKDVVSLKVCLSLPKNSTSLLFLKAYTSNAFVYGLI